MTLSQVKKSGLSSQKSATDSASTAYVLPYQFLALSGDDPVVQLPGVSVALMLCSTAIILNQANKKSDWGSA
jgi:hypothetical protein